MCEHLIYGAGLLGNWDQLISKQGHNLQEQ